ncbi:helicase HerA domain-containing protein [Natrialbaceae archaeon A-CW2]
MSETREVVVGELADGSEVTLPVVELLTGRGFVTGKSGSGKSNTASVIAEELLEAGFPLLIVDTDGEYYGLKEEYEMLHAGADEECDIQIGPEHAEQMASLALEENVPVILDVSGYLDEDEADELLKETARHLFVKEKKLKKPFLLVVEEVHEYIPEGGGVGETGRLLIKIGKRGRKHGLGILGISQRPADVKKDFITQANWLVWHRLTWDNDTKVVGRIIDTEYAELVSELDDGQAFIQTDWMEAGVNKIQFRRKRTFDAGATPGLDDFERPELKSVSDALVDNLQDISERKDREENKIEELEKRLERRESRIDNLEEELSSARDVSEAARQMAEALSGTETVQTTFPESGDDLRRLHEELVDLEAQVEQLETERDELVEQLEERDADLESRENTITRLEGRIDRLEDENDRLRDRCAELEMWLEPDETADDEARMAPDDDGATADDDDAETGTRSETPIVQAGGAPHEFGYTEIDDTRDDEILESDTDDVELALDTSVVVADELETIEELLGLEEIETLVDAACNDSRCTARTARAVIEVIAIDGPARTETVAASVDRSPVAVQSLVSELRVRDVLDRNDDGTYSLHETLLEAMRSLPEAAAENREESEAEVR